MEVSVMIGMGIAAMMFITALFVKTGILVFIGIGAVFASIFVGMIIMTLSMIAWLVDKKRNRV
jgi:hypothetical protein